MASLWFMVLPSAQMPCLYPKELSPAARCPSRNSANTIIFRSSIADILEQNEFSGTGIIHSHVYRRPQRDENEGWCYSRTSGSRSRMGDEVGVCTSTSLYSFAANTTSSRVLHSLLFNDQIPCIIPLLCASSTKLTVQNTQVLLELLTSGFNLQNSLHVKYNRLRLP